MTSTEGGIPAASMGEPNVMTLVTLYCSMKAGSVVRAAAVIPPWEWPESITGAPGSMPACSMASATAAVAVESCPDAVIRFPVRSVAVPEVSGLQDCVPGMVTI